MFNKRIAITGGYGFLGKYVVKELRDKGYDNLIYFYKKEYDLRDEAHVHRMYQDCRPEIVIHLAADCGGIGYNKYNSHSMFYNNMLMGLHLIHHAVKYSVDKFVQVGTVCSYPKYTPVPFSEEELWNGYPEETNAPYGIAKKMLLVQLQTYREAFGLNGIYLMPANLYGIGDDFNPESSHVIPALIRKINESITEGYPDIRVWGSGTATRDFLNVKDAARAIVMAMEKYNEPGPINIGTGEEVPISQVVGQLISLMNYKGKVFYDRSKPDGQPRRCLNVIKAYRKFGWQSTIPLAEGLAEVVKWYLELPKKGGK